MNKALELDPTYALAWAGLADAFSACSATTATCIPRRRGTKGARGRREALRHGPDLAEAHTARAVQALLFEWDWSTAERSFCKALELNPGYIQGAAWYHLFYRGFASGRWADAVAALKEWATRDPRSAYLAAVIAIGYAPHRLRHPLSRSRDGAMDPPRRGARP